MLAEGFLADTPPHQPLLWGWKGLLLSPLRIQRQESDRWENATKIGEIGQWWAFYFIGPEFDPSPIKTGIKWSNYEKFSPELHPSLMFLFGRQKFANLYKFGSSSLPWPLSSVTHVEMLVCKWMPSGNSRLDTKLAFTKQTFSLSPLFGWVYLCSTFCHLISEEANKKDRKTGPPAKLSLGLKK